MNMFVAAGMPMLPMLIEEETRSQKVKKDREARSKKVKKNRGLYKSNYCSKKLKKNRGVYKSSQCSISFSLRNSDPREVLIKTTLDCQLIPPRVYQYRKHTIQLTKAARLTILLQSR